MISGQELNKYLIMIYSNTVFIYNFSIVLTENSPGSKPRFESCQEGDFPVFLSMQPKYKTNSEIFNEYQLRTEPISRMRAWKKILLKPQN